jgi:hypothetical protein
MPPTAERLADTAAWPWRKSKRYMVIWPSEMSARAAERAIHA